MARARASPGCGDPNNVEPANVKPPNPTAAGFSLIEVMVALIVLSVGLLGVARLESLALSSTRVAGQRSIAAIEAASLADAMHENRGYWSGTDPAGATITIQGTTLSYAGGAAALNSAAGTSCKNPPAFCSPAALAGFDLQQWANSLNSARQHDHDRVRCRYASHLHYYDHVD
jgi:type IV pilus assembly protein PilV